MKVSHRSVRWQNSELVKVNGVPCCYSASGGVIRLVHLHGGWKNRPRSHSIDMLVAMGYRVEPPLFVRNDRETYQ